MNKDKIGELHYGNKEQTSDYTGRSVKRSAYGNSSSNYGGNIEHVNPDGGSTIENLIPSSIYANSSKADKFPTGKVSGQVYNAQKNGKLYNILRKLPNGDGQKVGGTKSG